ncbi:MAG: hypothetical protein M1821_000249 [Bathelium mastoideum]|nr:MAG: hypothetical protein M1821_000249 [Bathelium mastoideum]
MNLADRVQELGELELATLVCLVASQHCVVDADALDALDEAQYQLEAITSNIFGLTCATVDCSERLSVDDFSNAVLVESKDEDEPKHARSRAMDEFDSTGLIETPYTDDPSENFINGKASGPASNYPSSANETAQDGQHHTSSFSQNDIDELQSLAAAVRVTAEVRGYLHNVLTFLRAHRAVAGGVSATATRHLNLLVRALAPLHALSFVPPSLVALATRKVYSHRLVLTAPENERSLQWGSSIEAVQELLDNVTVQDVIEEVLKTVEVPL